jgi:hypothetical protein
VVHGMSSSRTLSWRLESTPKNGQVNKRWLA